MDQLIEPAKISKLELVTRLSERLKTNRQKTLHIIETVLDALRDEICSGTSVSLRNFGTFEVRMSKPRVGRNPRIAGSEKVIESRPVVRFKPSERLRQQLAGASLDQNNATLHPFPQISESQNNDTDDLKMAVNS